MAMDLDFDEVIDTSKIEIEDNFAPMPEGTYEVMVSSGEIRETKSKDGKYLMLQFDIVAPEQYNKRKLFHIFNLWNKNEVATKIAQQELKKMTMAIFGKDMKIKSADEFLDKICYIFIIIDEYQGKKNNKIKYFLSEKDVQKTKIKQDKKSVKDEDVPF